jgi:hypothetical protein
MPQKKSRQETEPLCPASEPDNSRKFLHDRVEKRHNLVHSNILRFSIQKINQLNDERVGIKYKGIDDVNKILQDGRLER